MILSSVLTRQDVRLTGRYELSSEGGLLFLSRGMMVAFRHICGMDASLKLALKSFRSSERAVGPRALMKEGGMSSGPGDSLTVGAHIIQI